MIGVAFDVWMVVPNWNRDVTKHPDIPGADLNAVADHVDHVCQMLGTTRHIGIGTDLDGGFGTEQTPSDLDRISDLNAFFAILAKRGYNAADLEAIAHGNFLSLLKRAWT